MTELATRFLEHGVLGVVCILILILWKVDRDAARAREALYLERLKELNAQLVACLEARAGKPPGPGT